MGQAYELVDAGAQVVVSDLSELVQREPDEHRPAGPRSHRLRASARRLLAAEEDFPVDERRLVERRFDPAFVPRLESIFALTNGYLGLRGAPDEVSRSTTPALLNGFYETWPMVYPERAYGFAKTTALLGCLTAQYSVCM